MSVLGVYVGLFALAFGAATLLPLQSEAVLVGLILSGKYPLAALLAVATIGNVLGSVVNWALGRGILRFKQQRWFPITAQQLTRAEMAYRRYGRWSLLGSWLPFVGDPLTVVAGVLREPLKIFLPLVLLAKGGRYLVLAYLAT